MKQIDIRATFEVPDDYEFVDIAVLMGDALDNGWEFWGLRSE